jgi:hypothetical protein
MPFRQAYRDVAEELRSGRFVVPLADAANDPTIVTAAQVAATRERLAEGAGAIGAYEKQAARAEALLSKPE